MAESSPDLSDLLEQVFRSLARRLWGSLPGRITAYNAAAGTVSVQPIPADYQDGLPVSLPILADVPVAWPRGGGASITWPLSAGDHVLLVFASRPIGRWRNSAAEGDPGATRTHSLSDAIAVPAGVSPDGSVITPAPNTSHLEIRKPTGGKILLDGGGKGVARLDDSVNGGVLSMTAVTVAGPPVVTTLTFLYTPPTGAPTTVALALAGALAGSGAGSIRLEGVVDTASATVESG